MGASACCFTADNVREEAGKKRVAKKEIEAVLLGSLRLVISSNANVFHTETDEAISELESCEASCLSTSTSRSCQPPQKAANTKIYATTPS